MVLENYSVFLNKLRAKLVSGQPRARRGVAQRLSSAVATAAECLEVRVVPAAMPTLEITPAVTADEGNSETQDAVFTVTLSAASANTVTVIYTTADGSATEADNDYQYQAAILTFAPGETSKTISIPVNGDTKFETDESFVVVLLSPTNAKLNRNNHGTATITNDDSVPAISIGSPEIVFEGNSGTKVVNFPVTLTNASSQTVTVHYSTADGTATIANNDYQAASGTVTFAPGETTKMVSVKINGDTVAESDETFTVNLSLPSDSPSTLGTATGTATIGDDDTLPVLSVNNPAQIDEGASGSVTLLFTVTLSSASAQTVTVNYTTVDGTATSADNDYESASGTLTFAPGQTTKTISVVVNGDTKNEANETILLQLSAATNARVGISPGTATITNDDYSLPTVSISQPVSVTEGNSGTVAATFHLILSQAAGQTITVAIATADGTAKVSDGDYVAGSATITFAPGEIDKTFVVQVNGDTKLEGNENFSVTLSSAVNATIATGQLAGTILNDDGGTVSITRTNDAAETSPPSKGRFTVTQSGVSSMDTVVTYTVEGTATPGEGNDYQTLSGTVTIPAGQTSATIDVTPYNDDEADTGETVIVTLTGFTAHDETIELDPISENLTATLQILDAVGLPALDLGGGPVTYVAKRAAIKVLPELTVGDATLGGGTLFISVDAVISGNKLVDRFKFPGFKSLGTSTGLVYVGGQLQLTINLKSNVTAAAIQSYLRGIKFSTKGTGLDAATRTFVATLTDAASHSSSVTQTINVQSSPA